MNANTLLIDALFDDPHREMFRSSIIRTDLHERLLVLFDGPRGGAAAGDVVIVTGESTELWVVDEVNQEERRGARGPDGCLVRQGYSCTRLTDGYWGGWESSGNVVVVPEGLRREAIARLKERAEKTLAQIAALEAS